MTTILVDRGAVEAAPEILSPAVRPRRAGQGSGRGTGPRSRASVAVGPVGSSTRTVRACTAERALESPVTGDAGWRFTERGIAVILVLVAMIVTSAVAVIALTAVRVTGEHYQPYGSAAQLSQAR